MPVVSGSSAPFIENSSTLHANSSSEVADKLAMPVVSGSSAPFIEPSNGQESPTKVVNADDGDAQWGLNYDDFADSVRNYIQTCHFSFVLAS